MTGHRDTDGHECVTCGALPGDHHSIGCGSDCEPDDAPCRYCGWPVHPGDTACASCANLDIVRTVERFERNRR